MRAHKDRRRGSKALCSVTKESDNAHEVGLGRGSETRWLDKVANLGSDRPIWLYAPIVMENRDEKPHQRRVGSTWWNLRKFEEPEVRTGRSSSKLRDMEMDLEYSSNQLQ
jgi:hypothetical protein